MWGVRYWPARYWGPRYWGKIGAVLGNYVAIELDALGLEPWILLDAIGIGDDMQARLVFRKNTDNRLYVTGARTRNLSTGVVAYLDGSATVTATVLDRLTQVALTGETWPVALTYITASDGDYHGPLRDSLVVTTFQLLDVVVTIDNGTDQKRTIVLQPIVEIDTEGL